MEESIQATMAASWGAVDFDWRIIPLLIFGWYLLLKRWERDGVLDRWNATRVFGFVLMVRTKRGLDLLEKVAKPRKFWRIYGEISLWVCTFAMFMVALVMLLAFVGALLSPPDVPPPTASELVAIPGINPMIPLWWGLIGFIVALVIHEFGHGLLARGHGMRIRSFGLLQLGPLPLGAFAEPEGEELFKAPRRERQRMFAAGPATNLFAAFVLLLLLGGIAGQFASDDQSIHVTGIVKGEGADEAGMLPWDTIETIQGEDVVGLDGFRDIVEQYNAGDSVLIGVLHQDGTRETVNATFSDKYTYYQNLGFSEEQLESFSIEQGDPFLGVEGLYSNTAGIDRLAGPLSPNVEYTTLQRTLIAPLHVVTIMIIPFEF
ncbi:MAG: site-2 protease family protein, partial [Candidatus Thermoplasmatota archaeon]|nr:site-2 protease family protein [Candidatus Thermoplasmatota archaeon]